MKFTEHDVTAMLVELYAVHQYAHEFILVRELAASHKLEQMCRVPMLLCMRTIIRETSKLEYIMTLNGRPPLNDLLGV